MRKFSFLIFFVSCIQFTQASQVSKSGKYHLQELAQSQRTLIAILDDQSGNNSAPFKALFSALEQKVGPLLVSATLLHSFYDYCLSVDAKIKAAIVTNPWLKLQEKLNQLFKKHDFDTDKNCIKAEVEHWIKQENIKQELIVTNETYGLVWEGLIATRTFKPSEWLILSVDTTHSLYLLIPYKILQRLEPALDVHLYTSDKQYRQTVLPSLAFKLGLNIDEMKYSANITKKTSSKIAPSAGHIVEALPKIFITKDKYHKSNCGDKTPAWTIYMLGHGEAGISIVQMPLDIFPRVLDFCEEKITTKLLLYNSCYGAGINAQKIYADLQRPGSCKSYAYPIITAALSDVPTTQCAPFFTGKFLDNGKLEIKYSENFEEFIERAGSSIEPNNYAHIIEPIMDASWKTCRNSAITMPQIKLPGLPWFSVVDAQNKVVSIGRILAATRDAQKPLDIMAFFQQQKSQKVKKEIGPQALLLYTSQIPFIMDMHAIPGNLPHVVSMISGEAVHSMTGIYAPGRGLKELVGLFELYDLDIQKDFIIDMLTVKNQNPTIDPSKSAEEAIILSNVIIRLLSVPVTVFSYNNAAYFLARVDESGEGAKMSSVEKHQRIILPIPIKPEQLKQTAEQLQAIQKKRDFENITCTSSLPQETMSYISNQLRTLQEEHAKRMMKEHNA